MNTDKNLNNEITNEEKQESFSTIWKVAIIAEIVVIILVAAFAGYIYKSIDWSKAS